MIQPRERPLEIAPGPVQYGNYLRLPTGAVPSVPGFPYAWYTKEGELGFEVVSSAFMRLLGS